MESYLTAKEAAEYLKLAERTLVRLAHEGKIPGVKIGGQWRFRRALLDEYLDTLASESVSTSGKVPNQVIDAPMEEIFTVEQIIPKLEAGNRPEVIHAMAEHVTNLGLVEDQSWLEAALAARERLVPTAVPEGVAFLHARRRAADKFPKQFIAMGRSPKGVVFGSPDMGKTWAQHDLKEFGRRSPCRFHKKNGDGWFRVDLRSSWVTPAEMMFIKPKG